MSADHDMKRDARVAYVLKGFPMLSETFISSEIHRLERAGVPLSIFVVKPRDEREHHPVIDRIRARPHYLPPTTRLSEGGRLRWLARNGPSFVPSIARVLRRRPGGVLRACAFAVREAVLTRRARWAWPKMSYIRDLLLGVALADQVLRQPAIRHLHAHFAHDTTTITWVATMITGLPFSFTGHAKDIYARHLNPRGLLLRKLAAASFAVTCTETNRDHLRPLADGTPVHRIFHGLNDDFAMYLRQRPPLPSRGGRLRLLGVGRLVAKKGFDVLVEACGVLKEQGLTFEAAIVGEEDEVGDAIRVENDLRQRIAGLGLDRCVHLTGSLSQAEVYERYRNASIFCLPCRVLGNGDRDGIPNVLVEAMACSVPVVSTHVSSIPELVADGVNGLLVPPDDPAALAAAVLRLHREPELAARLGRAGRDTVRREFDGDRLAARLADLFKEVIA